MDIWSKQKRSEVMSAIRGRGNRSTELAMVALFRSFGITGWRRHQNLLGRPDFVFREARLAVFVDGCFWHGCSIHGVRPKQNRAFWDVKISTNMKRDRRVTRHLRNSGWTVIRIWEHQLRMPASAVRRVQAALQDKS